MRLYSALFDDFYPFKDMELFSDYKVVNTPDEYEDGEGALVVWGGEDISPSLYNKKPSRETWAEATPSRRDALEWALMQGAKERGIHIIGVCRGAQMLCALAGGFLVQDVTGHGRAHKITTKEGHTFKMSSLHHQMLFPWTVDHEMLAWSKQKRSQHYVSEDGFLHDVPCEPEVVWFPNEKGLAIQGHPEYMEVEDTANVYVKQLIQQLITKV